MTRSYFVALLLLLLMKLTRCEGKLDYDSPMPTRITATQAMNVKPKLVIGSFANYGGNTLPMGPICSEGVRIALDAVVNASLLSDYELVVDLHDDKMCEDGQVVGAVVSHLNNATKENSSDNVVPIITGPTCSANIYTGHFLQYYNFVGLADGAIVLEIPVNRRKYNSFFMMRPSFEIFYEAIPLFLKHNSWSRVFLLTETFTFWTPFEELIQYNLMEANILLAGTAKVLTLAGTLPPPEHFQQAVRDLASYDPKIVIVNTHFGAILGCWLHHYGLFGPGYAYIFFGPSFFLPNSKIRAENCSNEMLVEVLQSVVYFSYGTPNNLYSDAVDALGTTAGYLDYILKQRINHPELSDKWFYWRSHTYSEIVATALILDYTEGKLKQQNDTLLNWVAKSDNFRHNGSYIHSIMLEGLNGLHYKGLNTYEKLGVNGRVGITGFFQMQLYESREVNQAQDLAAAFKVVPIAVYDSIQNSSDYGFGKAVWRTDNAAPPYDSLRIIQLLEPIVDPVTNSVIIALTSLLLASNIALSVLTAARYNRPTVAKSLPLVNMTILVGNMLILSFVLVLPVEGNANASKYCSAASVLVVSGFSLFSFAILAKLQVAFAIAPREATLRQSGGNARQQGIELRRRTEAPVVSTAPSGLTWLQRTQTQRHERLSRQATVAVVGYAAIQVTLITLWLGIEPPTTVRVTRFFEKPADDRNSCVAYQHFTYACQMPLTSPFSQGILATLVACYLLVALRSLYLSFALRKIAPNADGINDLHLFRIAANAIFIIAIAGCAVIVAFFMKDVGMLEIAVSILALIIVLVCTTVIFVPKLDRTFYL